MNKIDQLRISGLEEQLKASMLLEARTKRPGSKKDDRYKPFFISYVMKDSDQIQISAQNGALALIKTPNEFHPNLVRGEIKIGDYSKGCGTAAFVSDGPCDNDKLALKRELWDLTNEVVWDAAKDYRDRATDSMGFDNKSDAFLYFSKEKPVIDILNNDSKKSQFDNVDIEYWGQLLKKISGKILEKNIYSAFADLDISYCKRYLVNSEGTRVVDDFIRGSIALTAGMPDKNNRLIRNYNIFHSINISELPTEEELNTRAETLVSELYLMINVSQQKAGTYPTLVDGENHGVIWHEAIGHSLEGHRIDDGDDDLGGSDGALTFQGKIGEKVAPGFISVYDDPTDATLDGYYRYDEEGIRSQKVTLVKDGILKGYLLSRESAGNLKKRSNGHARASSVREPTPRMSNIKVCSNNQYTQEELKGMLIEECAKQGKEYGLIFEGTQGGYTDPSESYFHTIPKKVFRIYTDGRQEQVGGIYQVGTPYQMLENIIAIGDNLQVANGSCGAESGYVPSTETAPDALIRSLEVGMVPKSSYEQLYRLLSKPPKE